MISPDPTSPMRCPRCERALEYVSSKAVASGGELAALFPDRESLDVYLCPECGRVELFVSGIGEKHRAR
jgi:uncharacterized protein with PIN domain